MIFQHIGRRIAVVALAAAIPFLSVSAPAGATGVANGPSGLPLPRFVSLKSARVNMRVGPGREYHIDWMYLKRGLPMEVIQEYDTWRKVRDSEGSEGWILHSLLSGNRTAIVAPWDRSGRLFALRGQPDGLSREVARLEPGVVATVSSCRDGWCRIDAGGSRGFVEQTQLWGVYPDESFDN